LSRISSQMNYLFAEALANKNIIINWRIFLYKNTWKCNM